MDIKKDCLVKFELLENQYDYDDDYYGTSYETEQFAYYVISVELLDQLKLFIENIKKYNKNYYVRNNGINYFIGNMKIKLISVNLNTIDSFNDLQNNIEYEPVPLKSILYKAILENLYNGYIIGDYYYNSCPDKKILRYLKKINNLYTY